MSRDFQRLLSLKDHAGYKELQDLWVQEISNIEAKRDSAARRSNESAWRYWAGQEYGYKQAVLRLELELAKIEEDELSLGTTPSEKIEKLLSEARGEPK